MGIKTKEELDEKLIKLDKSLDSILDKIDENPTSDPNVFQINDVMYELVYLLHFDRKLYEKDRDITSDIIEKFDYMIGLSLPKLISEENGLNAFVLYNYFYSKFDEIIDRNFVYSDKLREYMNNLCANNLIVHKKVRDLRIENKRNVPILEDKEQIKNLKIIGAKYKISDSERTVLVEYASFCNKTIEELDNGNTIASNLNKSKRR